MYKQGLALNNLQWLICHKTKPNQAKLVNKILLPRYVNFYRTTISCVNCSILFNTHEHNFIPLLQTKQQGFGLRKFICEKHLIICVVYNSNSFSAI